MSGPDVPVDSAVVDLMREVADLHHRVYRLTDGDDPDWASLREERAQAMR